MMLHKTRYILLSLLLLTISCGEISGKKRGKALTDINGNGNGNGNGKGNGNNSSGGSSGGSSKSKGNTALPWSGLTTPNKFTVRSYAKFVAKKIIKKTGDEFSTQQKKRFYYYFTNRW